MGRFANGPALREEVAKWTRQYTKFEAMKLLGAAGVPCSAVYDSEDILNDAHLHARGMIKTIHHPVRGDWQMLAPPIHMSDSEVEMVAAPLLGEHTAEVLATELGVTPADAASLAAAGVLSLGPSPVTA
jgi:formyl-CoA transferase